MAKKVKKPAGNPPALLQWMRENLEKRGKHNLAGLAGLIGVHPSQVTRMMNDERRIKIEDLPVIATYLGKELPPGVVPVGLNNNKKKAPTSVLGSEEAMTGRVQVDCA